MLIFIVSKLDAPNDINNKINKNKNINLSNLLNYLFNFSKNFLAILKVGIVVGGNFNGFSCFRVSCCSSQSD